MKKRNWVAIAAAALLLLSSCTVIQDLLNPKPPAAPTGVEASQGIFTDKIVLSWNSVSKADSYYTYMASSSTGTYSKIGSPLSTSVEVTTGITPGTHYWFKVEAVGSNGKVSAQSDAAEGWSKTTTTTPGTPTGLTASQGTYTDKIVLNWTAVSDAASYKVYKATSATGTYTALSGSVSTAGAEITVASGNEGIHFFYTVSAVNSAGTEGAKSTSAEGWTSVAVPSTPTGLSVGTATNSSLSISWSTVTVAASYQLYRDSSSSGDFTMQVYTGSLTSYTDSSLTSGTTYYYKVKATNSAGSSVLSAHASGITSGPGTPQNVTATQGTYPYQITISWNPVSGASKYRLYHATGSTGTYTAFATDGTATTRTIYGDYGTHYWFKVSTIDSSNVESGLSLAAEGYQGGTGTLNYVTTSGWDRYFTNEDSKKGYSWYDWTGSGFTNGTFEIVAEKDSGSSVTGFGMEFNYSYVSDTNYSYWMFLIDTSGSYNVIYEYVNGGPVTTVTTDWTSCSYIHSGTYSQNTLKVIANSSAGSLDFYINGFWVIQYINANLTAGRPYGFVTGVSSTNDYFPGTPVDVWYYQNYPSSYPSVANRLETVEGIRAANETEGPVESATPGVTGSGEAIYDAEMR